MSDAYPLKSARRFSISALFEVGKVVRLSGLINTSKCGVSFFEKAAQVSWAAFTKTLSPQFHALAIVNNLAPRKYI